MKNVQLKRRWEKIYYHYHRSIFYGLEYQDLRPDRRFISGWGNRIDHSYSEGGRDIFWYFSSIFVD